MTRVVVVDPLDPDPDDIATAAEAVRRGDLVAFPTETVYGLGCDAFDADAVARIFAAKGRPADDPVIVHIADLDQVDRIATAGVAAAIEPLAAAFWPGPLTIVVPKHPSIPPGVTAGLDTVAIRWPSHPIPAALIARSGLPIAAPSANRFSYVSPTTAQHVLADLDGKCDLIIDGGSTDHGIESTVVRLEGDRLVVLRHGAVTLEAIEAEVGHLFEVVMAPAAEGRSSSPGRAARHYSPTSCTIAVAPSVRLEERAVDHAAGRSVVVMGYDDRRERLPGDWEFTSLGSLDALPGVANGLYENLRSWDSADRSRILLVRLTERAGLGRAIDDRISRAAGGLVVRQTEGLGPALRRGVGGADPEVPR